jgi:hypothetical protein
MSSSRLLEAATALGLSEGERAAVEELERVATSACPAEFAQLTELIDEPDVNKRYRELAKQVPGMLGEEVAWLTDRVRQALVEMEGRAPWAVLYLTLAHKTVVCRRLEQRLNPQASPVAPSAFVYAMQ